jgi:tetratricopeptide (TPR) repeat protein
MDENKIKKYIAPFLAFAAFFVYANALPNGFVWDDEEQVVNNVVIRDMRNLPLVITSSTFYAGGAGLRGGFYRPLVTLFYFINYRLWGPNATGFRLVQLVFHIANVLLLYYLLKKIFSNQGFAHGDLAAGLAALLFAVHPANVESVVYVGSIGETMYAFFVLLALLVFARGVHSNRDIDKKTLAVFFGLVFLGLLAKETAVVALPLAYLYWLVLKPQKDINLKFIAGSALVLGVYVLLRQGLARISAMAIHFAPISSATIFERLITVPYEVVSYLGIIFFPRILSISRHFVVSAITDPRFWASLIFLALVLAAGSFYTRKTRSKLFAFFMLWFFVALLPELNIYPLDMTLAERWLYVPIMGVLAAISMVLVSFIASMPKNYKPAAVIGLAVIVCILGVRTVARNENWKDGLTLYSHDAALEAQASPQGSYDLENNLGVELFRAGRIDEARTHFERSIELQPKWTYPQNNLGAVLEHQGDLKGALNQYRKSAALDDYYLAHENIANILIKLKRYDEAKSFLEGSLKKFPQNENMQFFLAELYGADNIGNDANAKQKALSIITQTLALDPQNQQIIQLYLMLKNNKNIEL